MSIFQTHLMYVAIILGSTISVWIAENNQRLRRSSGQTVVSNNAIRILFYIITILILIIPLVRRSCGADLETYYYSYTHDRINTTDPLFSYILLWLHKYIYNPKIGIGIISAATILFAVFSLLRLRNRINITIAVFSYVTCLYFYSYNYIRNMLAVSVLLIGYSLCISNKRFEATLPFLIAPLIHRSTIVALLIHLLLLNFERHRNFVIFIIFTIVVSFFVNPTLFVSFLNTDRYSSQIVFNNNEVSFGFGTIIRALPLLFIFWIYRREYVDDMRYNWLLVFAFANLSLSFIGYYVGSGSRISNMQLTMHLLYATPLFVFEDKSMKRKRNVKLIFILYCISIYILQLQNFGRMMIIPYY